MIIEWNRYFDAIYCINCLSFQKRRKDIEKELKRVGILQFQNFKFRETLQSIWNERFLRILQQLKLTNMQKAGELSLAFGHYYCLCDALQNNHQRILILEDDIRFLKDINKIQQILDNVPLDAEVVHFDKFPSEKTAEEFDKYESTHKINDLYCVADVGYELLSTGCYGIYRNGISAFYNAYNQMFLCTDNYANHLKLKRYFPMVNLACQVTYNDSMSTLEGRLMWPIHARYKVDRLDYSEYNMRDDGQPYDFNSYLIGK